MAVNPTPPATAAKSSFLLMPILSLPRLNHTIAALACVPVMCVASYAVGIANPFSLAGSAISAYSQESDYTTDYAPQKQSDGDLAEMTDGRLAMHYEMLMLFFALVIAIGALSCRGQTNKEVDLSSRAPRAVEDGRDFSQIKS